MRDRLKKDYTLLQTLLQGLLQIHINFPDYRCWGKSRIYTVKAGYNSTHNNNRKEGIWKNVWCSDGLPKIIKNCWLFTHQKILTAENLKKRGIEGPSRWILCKAWKKHITITFWSVHLPMRYGVQFLMSLTSISLFPQTWKIFLHVGKTIAKVLY